MKNYEFSIIKTWVIVSVILVLSSLLFPFIKKDYEEKIDEQRLTQPSLSIDKEIILLEKGNIDLLLSKPVTRTQLLLGKFLGSLLIVLVNVAYFIVGMWIISGARTGVWNTGFLAVTLSITYTFLVLYAPMLVIGIGSRSSALTIIVLYVFIFLVGPILENRQVFAELITNDTLTTVLDVFYYIFPKPDALGNVSTALVLHRPVDWMPVWTSGLFAAAMYVLAGWMFRRKEF